VKIAWSERSRHRTQLIQESSLRALPFAAWPLAKRNEARRA